MCPTDHRPKNARVVFGRKNVDCHLLSASEMNREATERAAAITVHGELSLTALLLNHTNSQEVTDKLHDSVSPFWM